MPPPNAASRHYSLQQQAFLSASSLSMGEISAVPSTAAEEDENPPPTASYYEIGNVDLSSEWVRLVKGTRKIGVKSILFFTFEEITNLSTTL